VRSMSHELRNPERALNPRKACAPCLTKYKKRGHGPPKQNLESGRSQSLEGTQRNVKISKILTTKFIDQIKYQRKKLKLASEGMSSQETDQATEGGCNLVDPGNACSIEPVINEDNESTTAWRLSLKEAILTPTDVPPVLSEVYDRLEEIFNLNQGNVEALGNEIDKFIDTHLNGVIKQMNNLTDEKENKSHNKPHNKLKRNNRNSRKRFLYARCQDIFKECPKRLANVVINNDRAYLEPARQPPAAVDIKRHYEDLWGQEGPASVPFINSNRVSVLPLNDYFSPITAEDVAERIKKIRKKAAAGPDGLLKEHLVMPDLPAIIAKLFNICYYGSYYPSVWKNNRTTLIPKPNKPSSQVENWRPITISPILGRIFSSILDRKLRKGIVLNLKQNGFTSENGCKINIELLNSALGNSKRDNGGIFTIVDISKAIDTIIRL
jgi:hypothetical protein